LTATRRDWAVSNGIILGRVVGVRDRQQGLVEATDGVEGRYDQSRNQLSRDCINRAKYPFSFTISSDSRNG